MKRLTGTYFCIFLLFSANCHSQDVLEDTKFGEDIDKFIKKNTVEIINTTQNPSNNTPIWNQLDTIYTRKNGDGFYQIEYNQYQRYSTADNSFLWNQGISPFKLDSGKLNLSYSLGAGDLSGAGYIPKYKGSVMAQYNPNNNIISPIIEYKHNKYQNVYTNLYGLYLEKYISSFRILVGPTISQGSFYSSQYGIKAQLSYYIDDNQSINYYFSNGVEPELVGDVAQNWIATSNSIVYKKRFSNNFLITLGAQTNNYKGVYNNPGITIGGGYEF